jgi:hypothetical protein
MNKNYIPFHIDNFAEIQKSLQDLYKDQYTGTSLKAFPKEWNRENFLKLYDVVDQFFKDNNATIIFSRFVRLISTASSFRVISLLAIIPTWV